MPKSKAALENMKALILLDLKLLLGSDISWQRSSKQPEAFPADALPQGGPRDDKSESGADEGATATPTALAKPAPGPAAAAPDPTNILTWQHDNWNDIPFDKIPFPPDTHLHKTKAYWAVAIIFMNSPTLCAKYKTVWSELKSAWLNTFGVSLTDDTLGMPPAEGPNAFSAEELEWCAQTRRFFRAGGEGRSPSSLGPARRASSRRKSRAAGGDEVATGGTPATPKTKPVQRITPSTPSTRCVFISFLAQFSVNHSIYLIYLNYFLELFELILIIGNLELFELTLII